MGFSGESHNHTDIGYILTVFTSVQICRECQHCIHTNAHADGIEANELVGPSGDG